MQPAASSQTRKLAILLDVAKALANQLRLDDLLSTIIGKTAEVLDADKIVIGVLGGGTALASCRS